VGLWRWGEGAVGRADLTISNCCRRVSGIERRCWWRQQTGTTPYRTIREIGDIFSKFLMIELNGL
jgi:hypothetical protein